MASIPLDAAEAYQRLGVKPIINAAGSVTKYGGTKTRPEVLEVMAGAARIMVNVEELNRSAGEELARITGAEAGFVCSGRRAVWCFKLLPASPEKTRSRCGNCPTPRG